MIPPAMRNPTLARRLLDGDRRALARAITMVEDDRREGWELVKEVYPHTGNAAVVDIHVDHRVFRRRDQVLHRSIAAHPDVIGRSLQDLGDGAERPA